MTNKPKFPDEVRDQKRFRRIIDLMIDHVDDEVDNLATALLAELDAPAPPDPNDNLAYDLWYEEVLQPMKDQVWNAAAEWIIDPTD